YTNDQLALDWLRHFIKYIGAGPDKHWRILLMDGHSSHNSPAFVLLALENHIQPFEFPSHMTHIL
ncbi:transposase, partial [Cadophora sp. DSE1049]